MDCKSTHRTPGPKISETEQQPYKRPPLLDGSSLDFGISNPVTAPSYRQAPPIPPESRVTVSRGGSRASERRNSELRSRSRSRNRVLRSRASSRASLRTNGTRGRLAIGIPTDFRHVDGHGGGIARMGRPRAHSTPFRPLELSIHIPGNELPALPTFLTPPARKSFIPRIPSLKSRPRSMSTPAALSERPRASNVTSIYSISRKPVAVAPMPFMRNSTGSMLSSTRFSAYTDEYTESELDPDFEPAVISARTSRSHSFYAHQSTRMLADQLDLPPPPPLKITNTLPSSGIQTPDSHSTEVPLALGPPIETRDPVSPLDDSDKPLPLAFTSPRSPAPTPASHSFRFPASTFSAYGTSSSAPEPQQASISTRRQIPSLVPSPIVPRSAQPSILPPPREPQVHLPTPSRASTASSSSDSSSTSSVDPQTWHFVTTPPRHARRISNGTMTTVTTASPQPPTNVKPVAPTSLPAPQMQAPPPLFRLQPQQYRPEPQPQNQPRSRPQSQYYPQPLLKPEAYAPPPPRLPPAIIEATPVLDQSSRDSNLISPRQTMQPETAAMGVALTTEERREGGWRDVVWKEEMREREMQERERGVRDVEMDGRVMEVEMERKKSMGVGRRDVEDGEREWGKGLGVEFGVAY
ncbi:MAG: hypothetical protein MMC23_004586 [Stictis urceolatum]|nr:hypothetical protein [Stictis urceolata]